MLNWIDSILERLKGAWPFKRIRPWERAVRMSYWWWLDEPKVELLEPGIRLELWFMQEIHEESVVEQVRSLKTQSVTTIDDVAVTFDGTIAYEVVDPVAKLTKVHDFDDSLSNLAMMHLSDRVRKVDYAYLRDHQKGLERSLRGTLNTQVAPWGVRVKRVGLTGLVKARQYRLYTDSPSVHLI